MTARKRNAAPTPSPAAPAKSRPGGRTQSYEERVATGRVMLSTWLSPEAARDLTALASDWGCTRREAIERVLASVRIRVLGPTSMVDVVE